ncbi:hypothetical protein J5N97_026798 [Dioscorea zingiberensis]|uniref:Uncharacterized protein n=1 Tax=Dioscorea zingiberensis TaxID=325984 RepID=A0A9D5C320_9LILI|nr:hypothetical protein J5N97_026798 [Dioscorea zingiberensis]
MVNSCGDGSTSGSGPQPRGPMDRFLAHSRLRSQGDMPNANEDGVLPKKMTKARNLMFMGEDGDEDDNDNNIEDVDDEDEAIHLQNDLSNDPISFDDG